MTSALSQRHRNFFKVAVPPLCGQDGLWDRVPDAKAARLYRDVLAPAVTVEEEFRFFDGHLARRGYVARVVVPQPQSGHG